MAGLKKKKKEKSGSPNLVLVIFLVFFILISIGLGIWVYTGLEQQEKNRKDRISAEKGLTSEKTALAYQSMLASELRLAVGLKGLDDDGKLIDFSTLPADEQAKLVVDREELARENGKFKDEKTRDDVKKLLKVLGKRLNVDEKGNYNTQLLKELDAALAMAETLKAERNAAIQEKKRVEKLSADYTRNFDDVYKEALKQIGEGNLATFNKAKELSAEFKAVTENRRQLKQELEDKDREMEKQATDHTTVVKGLVRKINAMEADRKDMANVGGGPGGGAPAVGRLTGDFYPLMLNASTGKALWDNPVGKVTRVDLELRQVYVNVGTAHGAKPELTFNIFGANAQGRAENRLKGSIEIVKVLDANTSVARITSLYDVEGLEILMNLQTRGRVLRESESPIREGDLLFNLFWGTRVAVAGYVGITGEPSDNPAEQMKQMEDLMYLLKRNGIQVDAYVDLRDGQIQGNITSKTRYLIRGDDLRAFAAEKPPAPKMVEDDKDKEKEPAKDKEKEPAKEGGANIDRNAQINASSLLLRNDARERGLLMVSAENFAVLIGYRRARSANSVEYSGFRPTLPYAGPADSGVIVQPPRGDQKGADPKEKDGN